jgi:hypothetical protein
VVEHPGAAGGDRNDTVTAAPEPPKGKVGQPLNFCRYNKEADKRPQSGKGDSSTDGRESSIDLHRWETMVIYKQLIKDLETGFGLSRAHAASELGKLKDKRAVHALIKVLDDPHMGVRSNAAFSLAELGAIQAIPHLVRLLKDRHERVRKSAAKALGMIKVRDAVPSLIEALDDRSYLVRKNIVRSLGQIGDASAIRALERATSDPDKIVASMAEQALEKLRKPAATQKS